MTPVFRLLACGFFGFVAATFDPVGDMSAANVSSEDSELRRAAALPNAEAAASRAEALSHAVEHSATNSATVSARLAAVAARAESAVASRRQSFLAEVAALATQEPGSDELQRVNGELDQLDRQQLHILHQGLHEEQRAVRHEQQNADARARQLARATRHAGDALAGPNASALADALESRAEAAAVATSEHSEQLVRLVDEQCDALERSVQDQLQQARHERESTQRVARQEALAAQQTQGALDVKALAMFGAMAASAGLLALAVRERRGRVSSIQEPLLLQ